MKKSILYVLIVCMSFLAACKGEYKLTENGKAVSCIVLRENATAPEKHAAKELSHFLGKISNGEKPVISTTPAKGKYPVYLGLTKDKRVEEEGFKITAEKEKLTIEGQQPVGVLYGVYEILKKDGGIRWLLPGDDGEYFTVKPTIKVKKGLRIKNPDFKVRQVNFVGMATQSPIWETRDWAVRNNMRLYSYDFNFRRKELVNGLNDRAIRMIIGGGFSPTLFGWNLPQGFTGKKYYKYVDKIFKEHPEYFPLVRGKRVKSYFSGNEPQPCTTNPAVIKMTAENIIKYLERGEKTHDKVEFSFGNNDCTQWCECENCKKIDPPEEVKNGWKSTRYWTFFNAVIKEVAKKKKDFLINGWTYQNFSRFPVGVKPSRKNSIVMLSNHCRCWKHALNDPNCTTNKWYYDYNKEWNDYGLPLYTYDELLYAGKHFLPNEKSVVDTLKFYKKNMPNIQGISTEIYAPEGWYGKKVKEEASIRWAKMWQLMYLGMYFHWDINADYDKLYEEANSLYYGKGWNGGMREFRRYLTELYMNGGGCWGFHHSIPVGKFLDVPGAKEKLEALLTSAEKAAEKDPDKRALKHVKMERQFFRDTWVNAYNNFISSYREIKAYPLQKKIKIDGVLDDHDWKNADYTTRFRECYSTENPLAKYQTGVKIAYDKDNIYIGVECLEPEIDKIETKFFKHDENVWGDNDVEFFIHDPLMGDVYYQIGVNAAGTICDGKVVNGKFNKSYDSFAEVKTTKGKDRWFVEIRLPVQYITGSKLTPGSVLKMNVMRVRKLAGTNKGQEASTWSLGTPHHVDTFHAVNFASPRAVTAGNRYEIDTRKWRNATFNEVAKKFRIPSNFTSKSVKGPARWSLTSARQYKGTFEYNLHPGSKDNYYVTLGGSGFIGNDFEVPGKVITGSCRLRGKGSMRVCLIRYKREKPKKGSSFVGTTKVFTFHVDNKDWKTHKIEFIQPGDVVEERQSLILWPEGKGTKLDIDDFFLAPKVK